MLFQVGNLVEIEDRLIPAMNIQVENVPGFIGHPDGSIHWYGVYFEIFFEDMSLWIISEGSEQNNPNEILMEVYSNWLNSPLTGVPDDVFPLVSWKHFLFHYETKIESLRR